MGKIGIARMRERLILCCLILLLGFCFSLPVSALPYFPGQVYQQSDAVAKHYADPPVIYDTPAFLPGREAFTSQEEMMDYLYRLQQKSKRMKIKIIGYSQEKRPIPLLVFSNPSYSEATDVASLKKPILWIQGQQHGDEPAGGEAMLVMAHKLALEDWGRDILKKVTVLIVPRCNPDGAYYFDRRTVRKLDINRDHIKLELPETVALHRAFHAYRPDLAADHHEYLAAGDFKNEAAKEMLKYHDMLLLSATNANVPKEINELADGLFLSPIEKALDANGLTHHWYYTVSGAETERQLDMGGPDAIIGRNAIGLQPALSFLVESRGIGLGRHSFLRRVTGHVVADTALISAAAQHPESLRRTVERSRATLITDGKRQLPEKELVVTSNGRLQEDYPFTVMDAVTGELVTINVKALDAKNQVSSLTRTRPAAYILPLSYRHVAEILMRSGVEIQVLKQESKLWVECYRVVEKTVSPVCFEGHFRNTVKTDVRLYEEIFPAGSYVIGMDQPNAGIIAMTLEPEASSSLVRFNTLPAEVGEVIPVYRYCAANKLNTKRLEWEYQH